MTAKQLVPRIANTPATAPLLLKNDVWSPPPFTPLNCRGEDVACATTLDVGTGSPFTVCTYTVVYSEGTTTVACPSGSVVVKLTM